MDATTERLAEFACGVDIAAVAPSTVHATRRLIADSLGCALGAYRCEPAAMARRLAERERGDPPARVLGSGRATSIAAATFANTVMVRYLDFNDMYISREAGHASDMLPALLAIAEAHRLEGRALISATVVACEMFTGFADGVSLWDKGFDHGLLVALGTAAGAGRLLGLDRARMANALSLAVTANVPLRQTRSGELSMWKGCATAASARAGVFAATLAAEGMTGPPAPFEGRHGLWQQVTGGPFPMTLGGPGPWGVERLAFKVYPTEGHSQLPLWLAMRLREGISLEEIERVRVSTYRFCYTEIGSEPQKWDPRTRETADHSLPYLLAAALIDGGISTASFEAARILDPALRPLMRRIEIAEDPAYSARYPDAMPCRVELELKDGRRLADEASYPRGHARNPVTDAEIADKVRSLCSGLLDGADIERAMVAISNLDGAPDLEAVLDPLCRARELP